MSPEFLKKIAELRQSNLRNQEFTKWQNNNPTAATLLLKPLNKGLITKAKPKNPKILGGM
jgi:hypothetical protein